MNYQMLIDKEYNVLRKATLSSIEDGSKTNRIFHANTDKRVDFLLCPSCFWCASYLTSVNYPLLGVLSVTITAWNNYQYQLNEIGVTHTAQLPK